MNSTSHYRQYSLRSSQRPISLLKSLASIYPPLDHLSYLPELNIDSLTFQEIFNQPYTDICLNFILAAILAMVAHTVVPGAIVGSASRECNLVGCKGNSRLHNLSSAKAAAPQCCHFGRADSRGTGLRHDQLRDPMGQLMMGA